MRERRPDGRDDEQECEKNPKNQHACNKIIRLEYARPFIWRSAHGQETPQDGKEDGKVSQVLEQESVEEKDREAIGEEFRKALSEAQRKTRSTAPQRSTPRAGRGLGTIVDGDESGNDAPIGRRSATFISRNRFRVPSSGRQGGRTRNLEHTSGNKHASVRPELEAQVPGTVSASSGNYRRKFRNRLRQFWNA